MEISLQYDYRNCLAEAVGPERGLTGEELCKFAPRVVEALQEIQRERGAGKHAFLGLPKDCELLDQVISAAKAVEPRLQSGAIENIAVLGIGGSALGMTALHSAFVFPFQRGNCHPRLFVLDNIDPDAFAAFLDQTDSGKTLYCVISKSGTTAETVAQFLIVHERLRKATERHKEHVFVLTDKDSPLHRAADGLGYAKVFLNPKIGGRFSVLSPVGLLPAAFCDIDVRSLCDGGTAMDEACRNESFEKNPAMQLAAVHYLLHTQKRMPMFVHFAYSERLRGFADWYRQLFAESLGKKKDLRGKEVFVGPTPIPAVGVTDQHSQVQLYTEGPFDKVFTFLSVGQFASDLTIPDSMPEFADAKFLAGRKLSELFHAEEEGTRQALTAAKRPNGTIRFPSVSARSIGEYILLMELSVALMGKLYGIDPYDQPGVEAGKIAAKRLLEERKRG